MATWQYGLIFNTVDEFTKWLDTVNITAKITETHVHHTYMPNHTTWKANPNHLTVQNGMKNYHVGTNGWDEIAQHITIFPDGKIVTGRNPNVMPVSAKGYNGTTAAHPFMFEMIGNFDEGQDKLNGAQLDTAVRLCAYWKKRSGAPVVFHCECLINGKPPKSCPGTGIGKNWFTSKVDEILAPPVVTKEEPKVVAPVIPQWKLDVIKQAEDLAIIEKGKHNPDDPADKAFVLAAILNALKGV